MKEFSGTQDETKMEQQINAEINKLSHDEVNAMMFETPAVQKETLDTEDEEDEIDIGQTIYAQKVPDALTRLNNEDTQEEEQTAYPTIHSDQPVRGKRKKIDYGNEDEETVEERTYRALQAAKANKKIVNGVVVAARMVALPNNMEDVLFTVMVTENAMRGAKVYIKGEDMTNILHWNKQENTKSYTISLRRRFAKGLINAEVQFCIDNITLDQDDDSTERTYFVSGNRLTANAKLKARYFAQNDPNSIMRGDIVNGRILAAFSSRVVYTVAGVDLYLFYTVPYITGMARIVPGTMAKHLFEQNESKDCFIENIRRDPETNEVVSLRVSFYEPLKKELEKNIDTMREGAMYSGTVIRYLPPKENGKDCYIIVKTDIGVEVLCLLPNWKKPPMELDSVKVKIVSIRPNDQATLVLGHIKR